MLPYLRVYTPLQERQYLLYFTLCISNTTPKEAVRITLAPSLPTNSSE